MSSAIKQVRIVVRGRVQGVGFRYSTVNRARALGLKGWVRNRRDGAVELVAQGDQDGIAALVAWCGHGPSSARVDDVAVRDEAPSERFDTFETRH